MSQPTQDGDGELDLGPAHYVGGGLLLAGAVAMLAALAYSSSDQDARRTAFMTYDEGLRQRLDLCVRDRELDGCTPEEAPRSNGWNERSVFVKIGRERAWQAHRPRVIIT